MRTGNKILTVFILSFITLSCSEESYRVVFTELETGTTAAIRALHVVSEDIIWASGSGGIFMLTTDGGEVWKTDTIPGSSGDDFRSLHAWNEKEAIVFGTSRPGRAFFTGDGGESWELVYENNTPGIFFNSAFFADDSTGLALSDPIDSCSFVISTTDRGRSWQQVENMPRGYRSCIIWLQDEKRKIAFAIGKTGCDYSPDMGRTWLPGTDIKDYYTARAVEGTFTGFAAGAGGKIARFVLEGSGPPE